MRLPVARLIECGVDPDDLRSIALVFDRRQTGVVYTGDKQNPKGGEIDRLFQGAAAAT
jgi:hypothetical protein